jgi:hypothetical protein
MFGYVRPLKGELLVKEFTRYRSIYCGICKRLGALYGPLPRLGVNYDVVLLGLLLLSLSEEDPGEKAEPCVTSPFRKKPVAQASPSLDACAAMTVLLAWHKGRDDAADGRPLRGFAVWAAFGHAHRLAARAWPEAAAAVHDGLAGLHALEAVPAAAESPGEAAKAFGTLMGSLFGIAAGRVLPGLDARLHDALGLLGDRIGRWIYLVDAIDDHSRDEDNGNWNPFAGMDRKDAVVRASGMLEALEDEMDLTCALLPYIRDAGIIRNIIQMGLPGIRADVLGGRVLARL